MISGDVLESEEDGGSRVRVRLDRHLSAPLPVRGAGVQGVRRHAGRTTLQVPRGPETTDGIGKRSGKC